MRLGSEGWLLAARLQARGSDLHQRKQNADSFHQTELQALPQGLGVTELVICGMQSDFCRVTTTRRAIGWRRPPRSAFCLDRIHGRRVTGAPTRPCRHIQQEAAKVRPAAVKSGSKRLPAVGAGFGRARRLRALARR